MHARRLNTFDLAVAGGWMKDWIEHRFPITLGADFAGTVEATGPGVADFAVGDQIFGMVTKQHLHDGGFAELAAVTAASAAHLPGGLGLADAGALGVSGISALNAVNAISPVAGQTVLIAGATRSVGGFAVQLASDRGLKVIATARPGAASDFVSGLGADHVMDYTGDLTAQVRALCPDGVDAAIQLAGDRQAAADLVTDGGHLAFVSAGTRRRPPAGT